MDKNELKINIYYKPLSVNKAYRGAPRFKTNDYNDIEKYIKDLVGYNYVLKNLKFDSPIELEYKVYIKNFSRSDVGNFEKITTDCLVSSGLISNDNIIKKIIIEKFKSDQERIEVFIRKLSE